MRGATIKVLEYVKVIYDYDWEEYHVGPRDVVSTKWGDEAYHTSDRGDALATADVMDRLYAAEQLVNEE